MASIGHLFVGVATTRLLGPARSAKAFVALLALSMLPDVDAIGFRLGVAYGAPFGHRGATHSIAFALLVALCVSAVARAAGARPLRLGLAALLTLLLHDLADAMTDGGLGVALLWPFSDERFFAFWRPLPVAPIGRRLLGPRGMRVLLTEAALLSPFLALGLWPRRRMRAAHRPASARRVEARSAVERAARAPRARPNERR